MLVICGQVPQPAIRTGTVYTRLHLSPEIEREQEMCEHIAIKASVY